MMPYILFFFKFDKKRKKNETKEITRTVHIYERFSTLFELIQN